MTHLNFKAVAVGIFIGLGWLFSSVTAQSQHFSEKGTYTFQPGDGIRLKVWQLIVQESNTSPTGKLSDDYTIDGDGYALFPIIGRIKVKGMTAERLIEDLKDRYSPYLREPVIYVQPLIRVLVQGAFNKPGAYRIEPTASLWELIEKADGPTSECNLQKLRVERGGKIIMSDLLAQFEKGYSINDIGIRSGDQLIGAPKSSINFAQVRDYLAFLMTAVLFYVRMKDGV
ncbi:polysaccharide biosynthesis/export family protein [candidate division KSB1 bacterium]|nr:polysaccharide biosynthesis/export family protein [candidate division KSB1 bacterium]